MSRSGSFRSRGRAAIAALLAAVLLAASGCEGAVQQVDVRDSIRELHEAEGLDR